MPDATHSEDMLLRPARHAARVVAAKLLRGVVRANGRLQRGDATASLHDVRVALRRLRTWVRAMRPVLDDTVRPRVRRRLRDLARKTGRARDLEVLLAWIDAQRGPDSANAVFEQELRDAWRSALDAAAAEGRESLAAEIPKLAKKLERQLSHYRLDVRVDGGGTEAVMAVVCADLVRVQAARLREELANVRAPGDAAAAHAARIAGKRLRYLLEPLVPVVDGARSVVRHLTRMQDVLGRLRDAHVAVGALEEHLQAAAEHREQADRLLAAALAEVESAHARVERECLGSRAESLLADAMGIAATLSRAHPRVEIERKFLLSSLPPVVRRHPSALIEQGYMPGTTIEERVRRTTLGDRRLFQRTVKFGTGLERTQIEETIGEKEFRELWRLTRGRRVRKRRYYATDGALTWEIDRFREPGIVVAEVELSSAEDELPIPAWIQAVLVREVTDDPEYSNARLAR